MTESKAKSKSESGISEGSIIIPEGYELVVVKIGEKDEISPSCPSCGGVSMHTAAACVYCGTGRTHYEYKKIGGEPKKETPEGVKLPAKTIIRQGTFEGEVAAETVNIETGCVVGNIVGGDSVNLADNSKAGFIFSPIIHTDRNVEFTEASTSVFDGDGPIVAQVLTIFDGGSLDLKSGSRVGELRLGEGVEEPGMFEKWHVGKIVRDSFPKPDGWNK